MWVSLHQDIKCQLTRSPIAEGELKRMLQSLSFGKVKLLQRFKRKETSASNASNAIKDIEHNDTFAVVKVLEHPRKRFRLPIITADVDVSNIFGGRTQLTSLLRSRNRRRQLQRWSRRECSRCRHQP